MKHPFVLTCVGLMLAGCSTTYDVPRDCRIRQFTEAGDALKDQSVDVELVTGHTIQLHSAHLQRNKLIGVHQQSNSLLMLPLGEVGEVAITDHGRGAGRGAVGGAVMLGVLSLVYIGLVGTSSFEIAGHNVRSEVDPGDATLFVLGCAGVGSLVGAAIGVTALSKDHYRFGGKVASEEQVFNPPKLRTTRTAAFQEEAPDQVCIMWSGRLVWLPKSEIKLERDGELISLTVPESLLEGE